jgi:hypothetical protein
MAKSNDLRALKRVIKYAAPLFVRHHVFLMFFLRKITMEHFPSPVKKL